MKRKLSLFTVVYTLFSRLLLYGLVVLVAIPTLICLYVVPQKYRYNWFFFKLSDFFYKAVLRWSLLPITIIGKENLPTEPAVFVANHSSSIDIPLLGSLTNGYPHVWMATSWLLHSWIFRLSLPRFAVLIDMSTPQRGVRSLIQAIHLIKEQQMHAMIFPEGGRFIDDKLHPFFGGFVKLAKRTERAVIPVRIFDLDKVYPPNSFWIYYHPVKAIIGKPMYIQEGESDDQFKDRVYQWFLDQEQ